MVWTLSDSAPEGTSLVWTKDHLLSRSTSNTSFTLYVCFGNSYTAILLFLTICYVSIPLALQPLRISSAKARCQATVQLISSNTHTPTFGVPLKLTLSVCLCHLQVFVHLQIAVYVPSITPASRPLHNVGSSLTAEDYFECLLISLVKLSDFLQN